MEIEINNKDWKIIIKFIPVNILYLPNTNPISHGENIPPAPPTIINNGTIKLIYLLYVRIPKVRIRG